MFAAAALNRLTTVLAILVLATSPVFAKASSQPVDEAFLAWWRTITSTEKMAEMYEGISIRFAVTYGEQKGPVSEIDRGTAEAPIIQSQIWRSGNSWRFNREPPFAGIEYDDAVWASGLAWRLNNEQLLIDDQAGIESSKYRIDLVGNDVAFEFSRLTSCTLDKMLENSPSTCAPVLSATKQKWSFDCTIPVDGSRSRRVKADGEWSEVGGYGTIATVAIFFLMDGQETGREEFVTSGWIQVPERSIAAPRTLTHKMTSSDETMIHTLSSLGFQEFTPSDFKVLTRLPRVDGTDAIRGDVQFVQLQDLRDGSGATYSIDASRRASAIVSGKSVKPLKRLQYAGWVMLAIVTIVLVLVRIQRARITHV
ncbi:MAG: hypothetical protein KF838_01285 [Phycisphaeraceae bacterium]|nr:MAG: hypothetical protein KF838_01285 [Phycisphaeraceae bacterium]